MSCVLAALVVFSAGSLDDVAAGAGDGAVSGGEASRVIYVHAGALGGNDGSNWGDAFNDLQDALTVAEHGDEIWVAAGVYKPDRGTGDPWMSFELVDGVELYGGFAGHEAHRHQRDSSKNETILSGDLAGNDDFDELGESGCCRGGFDYVCDDEACKEAVCALEPWCCRRSWWQEICARVAADVCCDMCRPTICENSLTVVKAVGASLTARLDGFTIRSGVRRIIPEDFSGEFQLNPSAGGGLLVRDADVAVSNCRFVLNAGYGGGGAFVKGSATTTFTHCLFADNLDLGTFGGALLLENADAFITNCQFLRNHGRGLTQYYGGGLIAGSEFRGNLSGGMSVLGGAPNIVSSRFVGNSSLFGGGGFASTSSSPQLINCVVTENRAGMRGGGIYHVGFNSVITLVNCVVNGNRAGGFMQFPSSNPSPGTGGGLYNFDFAVILNSVITNNEAGVGASMTGGLGSFVSNSILWGNGQTSLLVDNGVEVASAADRRYNVIENWPGDGVGNLDVDPLFVDPLGPDGIAGTEDDDLRLRPDSPLINRGDPNPPLVPAFDHDYRVRTLCGRVDIGAYEFGFGDFNCDRVIDDVDFAAWPFCQTHPGAGFYPPGCEAFDSDADGDVDLFDFAAMQNELSRLAVP